MLKLEDTRPGWTVRGEGGGGWRKSAKYTDLAVLFGTELLYVIYYFSSFLQFTHALLLLFFFFWFFFSLSLLRMIPNYMYIS